MARPKRSDNPVATTKRQLRQRFAAVNRNAANNGVSGRRLTKEEHESRHDSVILGSDAFEQKRMSQQEQIKPPVIDDTSMSFWTRIWLITGTYLHERLEWLDSLSDPYMERWFRSPIWTRIFGTHHPQKLLLNIILLLILVLGWTVGDYLLVRTSASAACTPSTSTVYVPYMETVTSTLTTLPTAPASSSSPGPATSVEAAAAGSGSTTSPSGSYTTISTFTTTFSHTTTVTAPLMTTSITVLSSSGGPSYFFYVTSGSTMWQNGVTPSSGVSLTTATTSVFVVPAESAASTSSSTPTSWRTVTSTSTSTKLTTVTLPPYTSTTISMISPALTTTLTSTYYTTYSLSGVSSRSGFAGMSSEGWNASNTDTPIAPAATTVPRLTKFTRLVYFGHDNITTSTSTMLVTATLGDAVTQTIAPPGGPIASDSDTTITAEAVTEALDSASAVLSTSLSFASRMASGVRSNGFDPTSTASEGTSFASSTGSPAGGTSPSALETTDFFPKPATGSNEPTTSSYAPSLTGSASDASLPSESSFASLYTITSLVSGQGTVFVETSSPIPTTPRLTVAGDTALAAQNSAGPGSLASDTRGVSRSSGSTMYQGGRPGTRSLPAATSIPEIIDPASVTTEAASSDSSIMPVLTSAQTSVSIVSGVGSIQTTSKLIASGQQTSDSASSSAPLSSLVASSSSRISASASTTLTADGTSDSTASSVISMTSTATTSTISRAATTSSLVSSAFSSASLSSASSKSTSNSTVVTRPTASRSSSSSNAFPSTSATTLPTQGCGEQGNFTMDFDTLPTFNSGSARKIKRQASWNGTVSGNGTSDITQQPPLSMRPYKHMLFSGGYVYSPQPVEPFAPASPPNVAVFLANGTGLRAGKKPNGLEPGEIADGPYHEGDPTFFFDAQSAQLGCDNAGPDDCTMEVTPYVWNNTVKDDVPAPLQNFTIPPCTGYQNCQLTPVTFPPTFRNLSGIRMRAVVGSRPRMFFVDDLEMRWSDSSCESGLKRQESA